jgi:hypothetical protein
MRSKWSLWTHVRGHEAKTRHGGMGPSMGRATNARFLVEHRVLSAFLCMSLSWTKTYAIFFLEFSEAWHRRNPSSTSRGVWSCRIDAAFGGKSLPSSPPYSPWPGEDHLHHPQHYHHPHLKTDVIPLIVCGRSNHGYCLSVVCIFVLGILSLFCGEVILSDCVVIHTPLIINMFDTCE